MFDSGSFSSIDDVLLDELVQLWVAEADAADGWDEPGGAHLDDVPPPAPLTRDEADALVATVLDVGPGPWAASMLLTLSVDQVSERVRFDLQQAWQAQQAWTDAQAGLALADHLGPEPADAHHDLQVPDSGIGWRMRLAETALVLRSAEATLRRRAGVAADLVTRLPRTREALLAGRLGWYQAMVISDATGHLPDDAARRVDQAVLAGPAIPTPATLRRRLRRAVIQADPDAAVTATRVAHDTREVRRVTGTGGQDCLEVWSDPRDIQALWGQLTALAGPADTTDPRPIGARRVDALLGLVTGAFQLLPCDTAGHHLPGPVPPKPTIPVQVQVVVDLPTLAGLANNPGVLVGHGPVPAGVVRDWLTDATTWRRLVCDRVTGHLLDYGPTIRFAPPTLKAFLQARDQHCTFPGCRLPAQRCDNDHEPPWKPDGTGGHTSATDMAPLCRHHHNWKTHHRWQLDRQPNGTSHWTSPTGRTYDVPRTPTLGDGSRDDPVELDDEQHHPPGYG